MIQIECVGNLISNRNSAKVYFPLLRDEIGMQIPSVWLRTSLGDGGGQRRGLFVVKGAFAVRTAGVIFLSVVLVFVAVSVAVYEPENKNVNTFLMAERKSSNFPALPSSKIVVFAIVMKSITISVTIVNIDV